MTQHFYFKNLISPTQFNVDKHLRQQGWESRAPGDFNDSHLILNETCTQLLEYKHLLASWIPTGIMPLTFCINDENYADVLEQITKADLPASHWILKPALLNNGEGIFLFDQIDAIYDHYLNTNRYGGEHVLQQYIIKPHLINGHKYTFRMFVVISNYNGAFLYKDGYFNVARAPYDPLDVSNLSCHLTNEHLWSGDQQNNWQIPTTQCPNFSVIYKKMYASVSETMREFYIQAPAINVSKNDNKAFSLFGFDFILDEKLKLWLLEVNHGPCFPKSDHHILEKHLYQQFWLDIIDGFVKPIANTGNNDVTTHKNFKSL
jgi:hypothetical protein